MCAWHGMIRCVASCIHGFYTWDVMHSACQDGLHSFFYSDSLHQNCVFYLTTKN
jgi:hypothetical protein